MPATRFALDTYRAPEGSPRRHKTCYVPLLLLGHECCMPACLNRAKSWSDTHARCCQLLKLRPAASFTVLRDGVERHMRSTLQMRRAGGFTDTSASFGLARRSAASTTSWIDICAGCLVPSSGTPGGRLLQTSCFGCSSTARAVRLLCGLGHPGHGLCYLSCWCLSSIGCIWRPHARYTTT